MVSIIIISYNTCRLTLNCIASIVTTYPEAEIVVVDNRSPDDTVQAVRREYPAVRMIVSPENKSYSNAVNIGMNSTTSEYTIVCNADVEFYAGAVATMIAYLQAHSRVGVCSPQQVYPDGTWQYCFGPLPSVGTAIKDMLLLYGIRDYFKRLLYPRLMFRRPRSVGYCDGAVLAIRRSAFADVGGFDESFNFYSEETDFCYRLHNKGWYVHYVPTSTVMHIRGASSGSELNFSEKALQKLVTSKVHYMRKHFSPRHVRWFIRIEIANYTFKSSISKGIRRVRTSRQLETKQKMFELLAAFYREKR
ncbi:MAG: glycosyltransferase family 2 protein [Candidatus Kapaibacterium sp.]